MTRKNGTNIANGVIAAFVLACGITFTALIAALFKKMADVINNDAGTSLGGNFINDNLPIWSIGFAYIVPGLLGVISAFVRGKGMNVAHMVFCILTLVVMGIFFVLGLIALGSLAVYSPGSCLTEGNICKCGGVVNDNYTCEELTSIYAMGVSIVVFNVLAWILTLTNTIITGILVCRQQPLQGVVQLGSVGFTPQIHDDAKIPYNMQS